MFNYDLKTLAEIIQGELIGTNVSFNTVAINSKKIKVEESALFVPIKGERFDGHDFIIEAIENGSIAFISEKKINDAKTPYILVKNTRLALGQFAAFHRLSFTKPVIGLTGSTGKTTTKAMIAAILRQKHTVLSPEVSMNNDIGMPLTLLELNDQDYAVIEMGTNHPGEILYLTQIAKPDVALITNIGAAHLEAFKNLDGVATEKSAIFQGLKKNGIAVVNADDPKTEKLLAQLAQLDKQKIVTFGYAKTADVRADNVKLNDLGQASFNLKSKYYQGEIHLQCYGEHNVKNALAAAAVASIFTIPFADIKAGLESFDAVTKRLKRCKGLNGSIVLDDSYSAIPDAVIAALNVLACAKGEKIFIFGGMAELNPEQNVSTHSEIGLLAKRLGVNALLTIGELTRHTAKEFGKAAEHFNEKNQLIEFAKTLLKPDVTVLIKGSRGMRMEEVVMGLTDNFTE